MHIYIDLCQKCLNAGHSGRQAIQDIVRFAVEFPEKLTHGEELKPIERTLFAQQWDKTDCYKKKLGVWETI